MPRKQPKQPTRCDPKLSVALLYLTRKFPGNPHRITCFPELREVVQHSSDGSGGVVGADSEHLVEHIVYTDPRRRRVGLADARDIGVGSKPHVPWSTPIDRDRDFQTFCLEVWGSIVRPTSREASREVLGTPPLCRAARIRIRLRLQRIQTACTLIHTDPSRWTPGRILRPGLGIC